MSELAMPPYSWQENAWRSFIRQVEERKLPHAVLITGAEGIGIERFGRAMAHFLLCRNPIESVACGSCKSCRLIAAGSHPDLFELAPAEKSKAILVDQVRELTDFVAKTAQQGGRKLAIIEPADAMNINAANSLLKSLEEPAGDTVLILVTTAPSSLMPTIRSRCSKVGLAPPSYSESLAWLQELGVKDGEEILCETDGAPLLALDWSQNNTYEQYQIMSRELANLSSGNASVSQISKSWTPYGALFCINTMMRWLDKLIASRHSAASVSSDSWLHLVAVVAPVNEMLLFRYRDALLARKSQLQGSPNLNATLLIEEMLFDWKAMMSVASRSAARKLSI